METDDQLTLSHQHSASQFLEKLDESLARSAALSLKRKAYEIEHANGNEGSTWKAAVLPHYCSRCSTPRVSVKGSINFVRLVSTHNRRVRTAQRLKRPTGNLKNSVEKPNEKGMAFTCCWSDCGHVDVLPLPVSAPEPSLLPRITPSSPLLPTPVGSKGSKSASETKGSSNSSVKAKSSHLNASLVSTSAEPSSIPNSNGKISRTTTTASSRRKRKAEIGDMVADKRKKEEEERKLERTVDGGLLAFLTEL